MTPLITPAMPIVAKFLVDSSTPRPEMIDKEGEQEAREAAHVQRWRECAAHASGPLVAEVANALVAITRPINMARNHTSFLSP